MVPIISPFRPCHLHFCLLKIYSHKKKTAVPVFSHKDGYGGMIIPPVDLSIEKPRKYYVFSSLIWYSKSLFLQVPCSSMKHSLLWVLSKFTKDNTHQRIQTIPYRMDTCFSDFILRLSPLSNSIELSFPLHSHHHTVCPVGNIHFQAMHLKNLIRKI